LDHIVVKLSKTVGGATTYPAEYSTYTTGYYQLWDSNYDPSATYRVYVRYYRLDWPGPIQVTNSDGSYVVAQAPTVSLSTPSGWTLNYVQLNSAGDTTGYTGNVASIWETGTEAFSWLYDEGERRQAKAYGSSNTFDIMSLRYRTGDTAASCSDSYANIDPSLARTDKVAHELGHLYHGRVVDCSGNGSKFPKVLAAVLASPHNWSTGEGNSLAETIPSVLSNATVWDPGTAASSSVQNWAPCYQDTFDNANRASATRNNGWAFWEGCRSSWFNA
jgi:hypothetical protein